jgi:hypothetical protein
VSADQTRRSRNPLNLSFVMVGLDPTIHAAGADWILGSSPRMTGCGGDVADKRKLGPFLARALCCNLPDLSSVMVGLAPTIHAVGAAWMLGSIPSMTKEGVLPAKEKPRPFPAGVP